MKMFFSFIVFPTVISVFVLINFSVALEDGQKVCFNRLGCFSLEEPWVSLTRPISAPMAPDKINTRAYFYSRRSPNTRREIQLHPVANLNGVPFNRTLPTAVIIHGFASNGNATWMHALKDAFLTRVDGNVVMIDWGTGASLFNYLQVAGNTRVVGAEIARMVSTLGVDPANLHLIGHSLGSHVAAYAAKATPGVARITALDPAQPAFEGFDSKVRLDRDDAAFVDVIHTDARPFIPTFGLGMMQAVGHVDFYLNGGFDQPGCIIPDTSKLPVIVSLLDLAKYPVEVLSQIAGCPHSRSYEYFTESLSNREEDCVFWGHKASIPTILKGVANALSQGFLGKLTALSPSCSSTDCTLMGLRTKLSKLRGSFVVTTRGKPPFCIKEKGAPEEEEEKRSNPAAAVSKAFSGILGHIQDTVSWVERVVRWIT